MAKGSLNVTGTSGPEFTRALVFFKFDIVRHGNGCSIHSLSILSTCATVADLLFNLSSQSLGSKRLQLRVPQDHSA